MATTPFIDKIPALVQGISRQAPSVRFPGQVEAAENVFFNIVDGARKRRGSNALTSISGAYQSRDYMMHRIERDDNEEYVIVYGEGMFRVVDTNTGQTWSASDGYLSGTAAQNLRFVTIADSTFVVNTQRTPSVTDSTGREINPDNMPRLLQRVVTNGNISWQFSIPNWKTRSYNRQVIKSKPLAYGNMFQIKYGPDPATYLIPGTATAKQIQECIQGNGVKSGDMFKELMQQQSFTNAEGTYSTSDIVSYNPRKWQCIDPLFPYWTPDLVWPASPASGYGGVEDALALEGPGWFTFGKIIVSGGPINVRDVVIQISPDIIADSMFSTSRGHTVELGDRDMDMAPPFAYNPSNDPEGTATAGLPIRDIGYIRNRLVIATDEFMCFSAVDDMFNFYMEEPPTLIDSDPIVAQLAATDVCLIDFVVPFRKAILALTSAGQQFELTGGDVLAPDTAAVSPSTRYETQKIKPVQIGDRLFMVGRSADYSTLLEYFYDDAAVSNTATTLTKHVDTLLPRNMKSMAASPTQECVFLLPELVNQQAGQTVISNAGTDTTPALWTSGSSWDNSGSLPDPFDTFALRSGQSDGGDVLYLDTEWPTGAGSDRDGTSDAGMHRNTNISGDMYVYRSYTAGNERKQSSWSKWNFGRDRIMDCKIIDDEMIILRKQTMSTGGTHLIIEKLDLSESPDWADTNFATVPHLDHRLEFQVGDRHSVVDNGDGTHTSKYKLTSSTEVGGAYPSSYSDTEISGVVLADGSWYSASSAQVSAEGDAFTFTHADTVNPNNSRLYAGRSVRAEIEMTQIYARDREKRVVTDGRTMLKKMIVEHRRSGDYVLTCDHSGSGVGTRTETFAPAVAATPETGTQTFWIHGESKDLTLKLTSNNPQPVTWTSIETHGTHSSQTE